MKPLVSIIIPVYNGKDYLNQAIDSALRQDYDNIEVIVVNDGSNDDGATERIALEYGDRIRYYSKLNGGVSSALNYGIAHMKGEYFSWLSHDDMYTTDKISSQISIMPEDWENTLLLCGTSSIDKDSYPISRPHRPFPERLMTNTEILHEIFKGNTISGCALLVPKIAFDKYGVFNENYRFMQDMDMWYRMLVGGMSLKYNDKVGVLSRVHPDQFTVKGKSVGKEDANKVGMFMVDSLRNISYKSTPLLKEYMFLCYRNASNIVGEKAYEILNNDNNLKTIDKSKAFLIKVYGRIRPIIVRVYYKVKFGIKVEK